VRTPLRTRFWIETTLTATSASALAATLVSRTWIETVFGIDPDRHSGSFEWALACALCLLTILFGQLARSEWHLRARRLDPAAGHNDG
jgi:hypothetical protein